MKNTVRGLAFAALLTASLAAAAAAQSGAPEPRSRTAGFSLGAFVHRVSGDGDAVDDASGTGLGLHVGYGIHPMVSVFARGLLKRLVTRIYFPDESESNARDPVLSSIEDPEFRKSLVANDEGGALRFDVHLQGDNQTAFFEH